jgi:dihydrofolate reductase
MKSSMIVAMNQDNIIGVRGRLPWKNKEDMAFFKKTTLGHAVIMGRKTFESLNLPQGLPGRFNVVVSRTLVDNPSNASVKVVNSLEEAYTVISLTSHEQIFIIGGGEIYRQALLADIVDTIYLTIVNAVVPYATPEESITRFPKLTKGKWAFDDLQAGERDGVNSPNLYFTLNAMRYNSVSKALPV